MTVRTYGNVRFFMQRGAQGQERVGGHSPLNSTYFAARLQKTKTDLFCDTVMQQFSCKGDGLGGRWGTFTVIAGIQYEAIDAIPILSTHVFPCVSWTQRHAAETAKGASNASCKGTGGLESIHKVRSRHPRSVWTKENPRPLSPATPNTSDIVTHLSNSCLHFLSPQ